MSYLNTLTTKEPKDIAAALQKLYKAIFDSSKLRMSIVTNGEKKTEIETALSAFKNIPVAFEGSMETDVVNEPVAVADNVFVPLPLGTNFAGVAIQAVPYTHVDSIPLTVIFDCFTFIAKLLGKMLTNKFLHKEVREKNGAYGGGSSYSAMSGIFSFYSYRDPNPRKSVALFEESLDFIRESPFTQKVWNSSLF